MDKIIIGSARIDEKGGISGAAGDQTGKEVATQSFYVHKKGWNIFRAKDKLHRTKLAEFMKKYCLDDNVGYSQSQRSQIMKYDGTKKVNCDCSSLVRRCIKDATGTDIGNFTTATEKTVIEKSGLFDFIGKYSDGLRLEKGDILCSCQKGHTAVVVESSISDQEPKVYQVGCTYQTNCNLYCRELPDKTAKAVTIFASGTRLTVREVTVIDGNIWIRSAKGWSAAIYNGKVRIV